MKKIIIVLTILIAQVVAAQSPALNWTVSASKQTENKFLLAVTLRLPQGWHVYTQSDTTEGLDGLELEWDNETISKGHAKFTTLITEINDPLFSKKMNVAIGELKFEQLLKANNFIPATLAVKLKGFVSNSKEFLPIEEAKTIQLEGGVEASRETIKLQHIDLQNPAAPCGDAIIAQASYLTIFIRGFAGGLIALLMPCLFPMIPVTVSFFTNRSATRKKAIRNGILYGLSILLIYILASAPFHLLKGVDSQIFNTISTNAWVNVAFFIIFIIFALSLSGLFELKLPSAFANKAGQKSHGNSPGGIFFMALTLVVVSFSCTGPILGALLVGALTGPWELTTGMAGFGLALALPFALFALFPQWLKSLPKSGGWLDVVKKSLAFVELALAIKFLSNADLVEHWGILKREIFIGCWILIAAALGIYLLSFLFKKSKFSIGRLISGTLSLAFTVYLIPGLSNSDKANLKLLSGFPPPLSYSIYSKKDNKEKGTGPQFINDYASAIAAAKQQHKLLLVDFTGWACVNCRKMEEQVWTVPAVRKIIEDNFILVSLYVDDREKLPADKRFNYEGKQIKTIGNKWALFQQVNFQSASQPMYVLLSPDEKLMTLPVGYSSPAVYTQWLNCGLNAFRQQGNTK